MAWPIEALIALRKSFIRLSDPDIMDENWRTTTKISRRNKSKKQKSCTKLLYQVKSKCLLKSWLIFSDYAPRRGEKLPLPVLQSVT